MEENKEDLFELGDEDNSKTGNTSDAAALPDIKEEPPISAQKTPLKLNKKKTATAEDKPPVKVESGISQSIDDSATETKKSPLENNYLNNEKESKNIATSVHCTIKPSEHGEASPGHILREARIRKNLSLDQVYEATKIVKHYIERIEQDDYSTLPSPVFVTAYIKSLCELYGIKDKESLILQKLEVNQKIRPVPTEILETIHKGRQVNLEAEKKAKFLIMGIAFACLLVIGIAVLFALHFRTSRQKSFIKPGMEESQKNDSRPIEELVKPPNPILSSEAYQLNSEKIKTNFTYPQFITQDELPITEKKK